MLLDHLRGQLVDPIRPSRLIGSEARYSLPEMLKSVAHLAHSLQESGVGRVALYADNGPEWVLTDLACQDAKIVLLPLPLFFSREQLEHALREAAVDSVLVARDVPRPAFLHGAHFVKQSLPGLDLYRLPALASAVTSNLPKGTGKITFTSGSTGRPKGVCLSLHQQHFAAEALRNALDGRPFRHLCLLPLSTLLENIAGVYVPLLAGGSVLVPGLAEVGLAGSSTLCLDTLLATIERLQPQSLILLPQVLSLLATAVEQGWMPPSCLQFLAVGGGAVSPRLIERAMALGLPVHQGYGLSESVSVVCLNMDSKAAPASVGRPLGHVKLYLDGGEIVVRGNIFLGYLNQPESWDQQEFRTGDLGHLDAAGNVFLDGRIKNIQVSSFGRNINPEWVESELQAASGLVQAIVYTESKPYCVALIAAANKEMTDAEMQSAVDDANARLPDYAQVIRWQRLPEKLNSTSGLLTENGRPRRERIYTHYASVLQQLYQVQRVRQPSEEKPKHVVL